MTDEPTVPGHASVSLCSRCHGEPRAPRQRWGRRCLTEASRAYRAGKRARETGGPAAPPRETPDATPAPAAPENGGQGEHAPPPGIAAQTAPEARTVALKTSAVTIADTLRAYRAAHPAATPIEAARALRIPASQALADALRELSCRR